MEPSASLLESAQAHRNLRTLSNMAKSKVKLFSATTGTTTTSSSSSSSSSNSNLNLSVKMRLSRRGSGPVTTDCESTDYLLPWERRRGGAITEVSSSTSTSAHLSNSSSTCHAVEAPSSTTAAPHSLPEGARRTWRRARRLPARPFTAAAFNLHSRRASAPPSQPHSHHQQQSVSARERASAPAPRHVSLGEVDDDDAVEQRHAASPPLSLSDVSAGSECSVNAVCGDFGDPESEGNVVDGIREEDDEEEEEEVREENDVEIPRDVGVNTASTSASTLTASTSSDAHRDRGASVKDLLMVREELARQVRELRELQDRYYGALNMSLQENFLATGALEGRLDALQSGQRESSMQTTRPSVELMWLFLDTLSWILLWIIAVAIARPYAAVSRFWKKKENECSLNATKRERLVSRKSWRLSASKGFETRDNSFSFSISPSGSASGIGNAARRLSFGMQ